MEAATFILLCCFWSTSGCPKSPATMHFYTTDVGCRVATHTLVALPCLTFVSVMAHECSPSFQPFFRKAYTTSTVLQRPKRVSLPHKSYALFIFFHYVSTCKRICIYIYMYIYLQFLSFATQSLSIWLTVMLRMLYVLSPPPFFSNW